MIRHLLCLFAAATIATGGTGCAMPWNSSKPPSVERPILPAARVSVTHYAGTPLSGPRADAVAAVVAKDAPRVTVTLFALAGRLPDDLPALGPAARLVTAVRSGEPVVPSPRLTSNAKLIDVDDPAAFLSTVRGGKFGKAYPLDVLTGVLPSGVTASFRIRDAATPAVGDPATRRHMELLLARKAIAGVTSVPAGEQIESLIIIDDALKAADPLQREDALVDRQLSDGMSGQWAVIIPFALQEGGTTSILAMIRIEPGSASAVHNEAVERMNNDIRESAERLRRAAGAAPAGVSLAPGVASALRSIAADPTRRATYLYLADQTGATLMKELALVAETDLLKKLAKGIATDVAAADASPGSRDIGWVLDRASLAVLADLSTAGPVAPEVAVVLTRYCGEVGRHSDALADVTKASRSREDFSNRLIAENLVYLEDSSPASRVRAYDWLGSHGVAPAKYDPLATLKERRAALETATATPTTQRGAP